jgi:opacity protein-like surface antigen
MRTGLMIGIAAVIAATLARADAPLIILDQTQLPFDLGPGAPANSPARSSNAPHSTWNSASHPANASSTWENRPSNPANESRLIITADGGVLGYYSTNAGGVLNLFDVNGNRIAYRPARGTKSLFTTTGEWCGTVDNGPAGFVLAVTPGCAGRFRR